MDQQELERLRVELLTIARRADASSVRVYPRSTDPAVVEELRTSFRATARAAEILARLCEAAAGTLAVQSTAELVSGDGAERIPVPAELVATQFEHPICGICNKRHSVARGACPESHK